MLHARSVAAFAALALASGAFAQKKPLDHSVYDGWKSVAGPSLSRDGKWILFRIVPQEGDAVLHVRPTGDGKTVTIDRGSAAQFSFDSKFVVTTVVPKFEEARKARRDKVKPEDQPKSDLAILNLASGEVTTIPKVTTFSLADKGGHFVVYKPEPPKPAPAKPAEKPAEAKPAEEKKPEAKKEDKPAKKADHKAGDPIVVRDLLTGTEEKIENVASYRLSPDGKTLAYVLSTKDGAEDGVVWYDLEAKVKKAFPSALGHYSKLTFDKGGKHLAFLTDKDDYAAKKPGFAVYVSQNGGTPKLVAKEGTDALPKGYWVPEASPLSFSEKATRLLFGVAPKPAPDPEKEVPDDEKVAVDVWNWQDPTLQPQQLLQASAERNRTYEAFQDLGSGRITVLESPEMQSATISDRGDGRYALGSSNKPYEIVASWDTDYRDFTLIDLESGKKELLFKRTPANFALSPTGKFIVGYDEIAKKYLIAPTATRKFTEVALPYPVWDEQNDIPSPAPAYGVAGWSKDDDRVLIYDRYDIWSVDPTGAAKPQCLTNGFGRVANVNYRYVPTDPEATYIDLTKPLLLSTFDEDTKDSGFAWDGAAPAEQPKQIVSEPKRFTNPVKADDANIVFYTRQDFVEYPDVWLADNLSLQNPRKVSDANPQQKDYNWGKAELVSWTSNDGVKLQGILIKPEDFDYGKKYPMITYFYERNSETLHQYRTPSPTASILNPTMAVSNGYVVFIPDIVYKDGYPGESAISCIMPGVQSILARGYVDPKRLAIDGQSWGGYQVAYMVTETNMFRCGYAGAPVSNMFSAYGGIRWGSGLVREFQYERGQSRIGYSIWEKPLRFLENSPLFFLDKVETPLLIMANDKDGAVPWYQGIELFTGLRRLQKPSWLLVYNDEDHNLVQRKNRKDLSIRKQQFFDYYLKDGPMPVWMKTGIPAVEKGKNMGLGTGN